MKLIKEGGNKQTTVRKRGEGKEGDKEREREQSWKIVPAKLRSVFCQVNNQVLSCLSWNLTSFGELTVLFTGDDDGF